MLKRELLVTCLLSLLLVSICPNALAQAWRVTGNNGTGCNTTPCAHFLGTTDNHSFEIDVNGQRAYRIEPATDTQSGHNRGFSPNVIGGFSGNAVTGTGVAGATIAGGGAVSKVNTVSATFGSVGGGSSNTASGFWSTVSGGSSNTASGYTATVAGGSSNTASDFFSTVGGGSSNTASGYTATVAGGRGNFGNGDYATVAGGEFNTAGGVFAATVAGGFSNTASGTASTVAGGYTNTASGDWSTVAGGLHNTANGVGSFAAGEYTSDGGQAGAFLWGDNSTTTVLSATVNNQFVARASGGVIFYTNSGLTAGVQVAAGGGSWAAVSDRNVKANFTAIDGKQILARLVAMPVTTWNYKSQDASIRHLGPMAQDFYAAFQVGEDNRHITQVDEGGVAFAAIQGLNQKLEELEEKVEQKDSQFATLRAQLAVQSERLRAQMQNKDAQISAQQRQIEDLQQQMHTMMARVEAVEKTSAAHAGISLVSSSR